MDLSLSPEVYAVVIGDDLIFLDVAADDYVCMPGAKSSIRLDVMRRRLETGEPTLAEMLQEAGLVAPEGVQDCGATINTPRPRRDLTGDTSPSALMWSDIPDAVRCLLDVFIHYRGRSFADILRTVRSNPGLERPNLAPTPELLTVVRRFHGWLPFAPVSGKCLLRSFMLLRFLRRRGHDAVWVFGVRSWPFAAHCWLQVDDLVLDEAYERLAAFDPILAI